MVEKGQSEIIGNFLREIRNEVDIEKLNETIKIMSLDQGMEMRTPRVGEKRLSETIGNFLREMRNEVDIEKLNETVKIMSLDQGMETMTP